jgi:hypothetical protein
VACEAFLHDVLKPRFLPEIKPTAWNYVIDIHGAWAAGRYRFMQRYRSGMEHVHGEEFDAPFARIDRMARDAFDIYRMLHTETWWRLHSGVTLVEALHILETDAMRSGRCRHWHGSRPRASPIPTNGAIAKAIRPNSCS